MQPNPVKSTWRLLLAMLAATLALGAFEGVYGRVEYSGDGISYLNVVRAIHSGDWQAVFSPYWGLGYPLALSAWLPLFHSTPGGEWAGILCLNLLILTLTFFSFYWLVQVGLGLIQGRDGETASHKRRFLLIAALPVFLSTEISIDNVSRVSPDILVACLVFASVATLLGMVRTPNWSGALKLGVLLGLGYLVKGIFLPLSLAFVGIEVILLWRQRSAKLLAVSLASMALLAVPYAVGLSWAYGRPSFGEVGSLNYAWYVNGLQMDAFWEGGPPEFGKPLHPPLQVSSNPSIYLFDGSHAVTYAPWFNPPYYFEGYRHFFSLKRQVAEALRDLRALAAIFSRRIVLYLLLFALILRWRKREDRVGFLSEYRMLWPLAAAALLGMTIYVLVYLQPRHVASFVALVLLALCLCLVGGDDAAFDRALPARLRTVLLVLLFGAWVTTAAEPTGLDDVKPFEHLAKRQMFYNSDQLKVGQYLSQTGAQPGDKVAWLADYFEITHCTWAYVDHLRIIGEIGGELLDPPRDELGAFWRSAPEERRRMLEVFHHAGARLVVALRMPSYADPTGWERVPGTGIWVYRF